jgi:tRNA-dihydrouridine synthase
MIRTYFQMLVDEQMHGTAGKMKQFVAWFTHGVQGGGALRKAVYSAQQGPEILASVDRFFEELLSGRTVSVEVPSVAAFSADLLPACGD